MHSYADLELSEVDYLELTAVSFLLRLLSDGIDLASPKSQSLISLFEVIKMFYGLISR